MYFDLFLFFIRLIEARSKYYKINIRYKSVLNFFTMVFIYAAFCVSVQTKKYFMFFVIDLFMYTKKQTSGYRYQSAFVFIICQSPNR